MKHIVKPVDFNCDKHVHMSRDS